MINIELSEDKVNSLVEKETSRYVREKIERVMNDGKAYWFSQQNIERLTRDVIMHKINNDCLNQIYKELKTEEFLHSLSDCITNHLKDYLFD